MLKKTAAKAVFIPSLLPTKNHGQLLQKIEFS